jgi:hypothetical protein
LRHWIEDAETVAHWYPRETGRDRWRLFEASLDCCRYTEDHKRGKHPGWRAAHPDWQPASPYDEWVEREWRLIDGGQLWVEVLLQEANQ